VNLLTAMQHPSNVETMSPLSTPARMRFVPAPAGFAPLPVGSIVRSIAATITTTTTIPSGWVSVRD
jgi:hypothetical protein